MHGCKADLLLKQGNFKLGPAEPSFGLRQKRSAPAFSQLHEASVADMDCLSARGKQKDLLLMQIVALSSSLVLQIRVLV